MKFFTITGIVVWILIGIAILLFILYILWDKFGKYIPPTLNNLWFYLFGAKWLKEKDLLEIWNSSYSHRSGVRKHFHSWGCLRKLAYIRFLREIRAVIHKKIDNQ